MAPSICTKGDMRWKNTTDGYGYIAITLHWLSATVLVATYALMELKSLATRGSELRSNMPGWHYMAGLTLFFLTWLRLLMRQAGETPLSTPAPTPLKKMAGRRHETRTLWNPDRRAVTGMVDIERQRDTNYLLRFIPASVDQQGSRNRRNIKGVA